MPRGLTQAEEALLAAPARQGHCVPWALARAGLFTDVVLNAHGWSYPAHRVVLAARSPTLLRELVAVTGPHVTDSPTLADETPTDADADGAAPTPVSGARAASSADVFVAVPAVRLDVAAHCTAAVAPHLHGALKVLYEGCDSDTSASGASSDMTVDEALAALAVLPGWGRSDLAATVADGFVASLDTQVEACLATLNRLEQLSLVAARPAGPKDASSNADENIATAATAEIQPVLDHCVSVATFMIRAAIGAVSVPALFGLCGEEITEASDESESRQPSVAIVQATPAEQIRSQAGELMIRLSARAAAQPSQSGKDWLQSPQLFIDAAVDLAPQWVLRRAVTDAAIDAHGRRPHPVKMEDDDDDSISADSSGRISMLGLLVLLRKCHSTVQRHLFAATAAIQEASPADVELLAVSDCVTAFAPFIDEVPPAFAVPVFAIASLVMQRGGPAVAMASRLARICLLAASTEPSSFSASWIQRVAEAQRSVLAVASGEAVSPPSFKRHRKEEPALVVSDTTTSGTSSSGGATLEASRHAREPDSNDAASRPHCAVGGAGDGAPVSGIRASRCGRHANRGPEPPSFGNSCFVAAGARNGRAPHQRG
jgi:hypothetical protein